MPLSLLFDPGTEKWIPVARRILSRWKELAADLAIPVFRHVAIPEEGVDIKVWSTGPLDLDFDKIVIRGGGEPGDFVVFPYLRSPNGVVVRAPEGQINILQLRPGKKTKIVPLDTGENLFDRISPWYTNLFNNKGETVSVETSARRTNDTRAGALTGSVFTPFGHNQFSPIVFTHKSSIDDSLHVLEAAADRVLYKLDGTALTGMLPAPLTFDGLNGIPPSRVWAKMGIDTSRDGRHMLFYFPVIISVGGVDRVGDAQIFKVDIDFQTDPQVQTTDIRDQPISDFLPGGVAEGYNVKMCPGFNKNNELVFITIQLVSKTSGASIVITMPNGTRRVHSFPATIPLMRQTGASITPLFLDASLPAIYYRLDTEVFEVLFLGEFNSTFGNYPGTVVKRTLATKVFIFTDKISSIVFDQIISTTISSPFAFFPFSLSVNIPPQDPALELRSAVYPPRQTLAVPGGFASFSYPYLFAAKNSKTLVAAALLASAENSLFSSLPEVSYYPSTIRAALIARLIEIVVPLADVNHAKYDQILADLQADSLPLSVNFTGRGPGTFLTPEFNPNDDPTLFRTNSVFYDGYVIFLVDPFSLQPSVSFDSGSFVNNTPDARRAFITRV